jgi:3',5'-cyclic AMP phosphodiesterase CpdA
MKRFAWLTDIHLNFLEEPRCGIFLDTVAQERLDGILISGDLAEGHTIETYLRMLAERLTCPVYFVLGNHDFYFSNFHDVRQTVRNLCRSQRNLHWLSEGGVIPLSGNTALVGHDGWADGRFGDFFNSDVEMTDYFLIEDLAKMDSHLRLEKLNRLGDEAAAFVDRLLPEALRRYERVILVTHVPPFREACLYDGEICDDNYLPHFACRALGESLTNIMQDFPKSHLTVLCGHTHGRAVVEIAPNLVVRTGGAEYGAPAIQEILTV